MQYIQCNIFQFHSTSTYIYFYPTRYTTLGRCHQIKYLAAQFTAHLLKTSCKSELCVHNKVLTKLRNMHMLDTTLFTHSYIYIRNANYSEYILLTLNLYAVKHCVGTLYVYGGCVANIKDILVLSYTAICSYISFLYNTYR